MTAFVYRQADLGRYEPDPSAFDLVVSSLALRYIADYPRLVWRVAAVLVPGGRFAFSVEHPIYTAAAAGGWHLGPDGRVLHWPVDRYRDEGERRTHWLVDGVLKFHRTVETYVNALLDAGLVLVRPEEPEAEGALLAEHPEVPRYAAPASPLTSTSRRRRSAVPSRRASDVARPAAAVPLPRRGPPAASPSRLTGAARVPDPPRPCAARRSTPWATAGRRFASPPEWTW